MPRKARNKGEFSLYHIVQRGNERKSIFGTEENKSRFLDTLFKMKGKYNFLLHGYCIMDNHVHLLINDNGNDISTLLKSINVSYALYFNRINNRRGHLFQDRFLSKIITNDSYLLQVSKYIHNKPVKGVLFNSPKDYRWSSYNIYIGAVEDIKKLVEVNKVLGILSDRRSIAIRAYIKYVSEAEGNKDILDIEEDRIHIDQENSDFISSIKQAKEKIQRTLESNNTSFDQLIKNLKIRDKIIKDIRTNSQLSLREIGELFGGISESRVSRIVSKKEKAL